MLTEDHPGFSDNLYRERRDTIASIANSYRGGSVVPDVPYISEEHKVWERVNLQLSSLYGQYACKEYRDCYSAFGLSNVKIPQFAKLNEKLASEVVSKFSIRGRKEKIDLHKIAV